MQTIRQFAFLTAGAASTFLWSNPADACGGFFCGAQQPVIQTGEQIVFAVDHVADTVQAVIQISYSGNADDFAWLLPLQSNPTTIGIGSNRGFNVLAASTQPRFTPTFEFSPSCNQPRAGGLQDAGLVQNVDSAVSADAGGAVTVLQQSQVGPYDTVVIDGDDPQAVRQWLETNEYNVTDTMMDAVVPYITKGDVLLALKLQKNATIGAIQPIALTMQGAEVCIPIRLTAIAAQSDMDITAYVLSNRGRAVPSNYFHVRPNFARIDWTRSGANYRQLIGAATDEAGGNAFTTEFAGSAAVVQNNPIYRDGQWDVSQVARTTNLGDLMLALNGAGFFSRAELQSILRSAIPDTLLESNGASVGLFWQCPTCELETLQGIAFDPAGVVDAIESRIIEPDRSMQRMVDTYRYLTRLYTLLSPEEMTVDPVFTFDDSLGDVSNQHTATVVTQCKSDGSWASAFVRLEDGTTYSLGSDGRLTTELQSNLPATLVVEQLETGVIIRDNRKMIDDLATAKPALSRGCGCDASGASTEFAGLGLLVVLGAAMQFARRRG